MHDLAIAEPHGSVAECREYEIATAVGLEELPRRVKPIAIQLEDETVTDHHIHSTDTVDLDLGPHPKSEGTKAPPGHRLQPGLTTGVARLEKSAS